MINLAENGVSCDCGSNRLAPAIVATGEPVICTECARCFTLGVTLTPVPWAAVALQLGEHDLQAFEWHRNGVPLEEQRTLLMTTPPASRGPEHWGTVAAGVVLVVLAFVGRAVLR